MSITLPAEDRERSHTFSDYRNSYSGPKLTLARGAWPGGPPGRVRTSTETKLLASAVGPDSAAIAAGPGGFNVANVGGIGSTAIAGASPTAIGQGNLAVVYGNMLNATVTGVSQGINIVTPFFNAYLLPLSGLKL